MRVSSTTLKQVRAVALLVSVGSSSLALDRLFSDPVLAEGRGVEVRQSQVDELYINFRANRAALGQPVPEVMRARLESEFLDRIIASQLLLERATPEEAAAAAEEAEAFVAAQVQKAGSEQSFNRQLRALGLTPDGFRRQIHEQAVLRMVVERKLRPRVEIGSEQVREFYDAQAERFHEPESVRLIHLMLAGTTSGGAPLSPEQLKEKRAQAGQLRERAREGEDFKALAQEFSEDHVARERGSEYLFTRAEENPQRSTLPEIEAAAFSLEVGEISEVISTRLGFHLVRVEERIPARTTPVEEVEQEIRATLGQEKMQELLPQFLEELKEEAGVKILWAGYHPPGPDRLLE